MLILASIGSVPIREYSFGLPQQRRPNPRVSYRLAFGWPAIYIRLPVPDQRRRRHKVHLSPENIYRERATRRAPPNTPE